MSNLLNKTSIDFSNIFSIASTVSSDGEFDVVSILSRYSPLSEKNPRIRNFDFVNTGITYDYCTRDRVGKPISFCLDTVTGARQSRAHTDRYYWCGDIRRNKQTKQCFFTWSEIDGAEFTDQSVDKNITYKTDGVLMLPTPGWNYPWGFRKPLQDGQAYHGHDTVSRYVTNAAKESRYWSAGMYQTYDWRAMHHPDYTGGWGGRLPHYAGRALATGSWDNTASTGMTVMPGSDLAYATHNESFLGPGTGIWLPGKNMNAHQHAFKITLNFEDLPPYTWVPLFGFGLNRIGVPTFSDSLGEKMYTTNADGAGTQPKRDGNRVPGAFTHSRNNLYKENTTGNERGLAYSWYKYNHPDKVGTKEYYDHISDPVRCNQADANLMQYWLYSHDGAGNAMVITCAGEIPIQYEHTGRCDEYPRNKMWGVVNGLSQWVAPIALTENHHFKGEAPSEPSLQGLWRQFGGDGVPREDGKIVDSYYSSYRIWHKYHRSDSFPHNIIENCPELMDTVGYAAVPSDIYVGWEWVDDDNNEYTRDPNLPELPPYAFLSKWRVLGDNPSGAYYHEKPWAYPRIIDRNFRQSFDRWSGKYTFLGWDPVKVSNYSLHYSNYYDGGIGYKSKHGNRLAQSQTGVGYSIFTNPVDNGYYYGTTPDTPYPHNNSTCNYEQVDAPAGAPLYWGTPGMISLMASSVLRDYEPVGVANRSGGPPPDSVSEAWMYKVGLTCYNIGSLVAYGPVSNADLKKPTEIHMNISFIADNTPINCRSQGEGYSRYSHTSSYIPRSSRKVVYQMCPTDVPDASIKSGASVYAGGAISWNDAYRFGMTHLIAGYTYVATGRIADFTFRDVPMITGWEGHLCGYGGTPMMPALQIRASVVGDCRVHNIEYASYPFTGQRRNITFPSFLEGSYATGYTTELEFFVGGFTWGPVELAKSDSSRIQNAQGAFPKPEQWLNPTGLLDGDLDNGATIKGVGEENALFIKMNGPLTFKQPEEDSPLSKFNILLRDVRQLSLLSYRLTLAIVSEDKQTTLWELPFENSVNVEVNSSVSFPPAGGAINFDVDFTGQNITYSQLKNAWLKIWAIRNV